MGVMMMPTKRALLIGLKHPRMNKDDDVKGKILRMKKFLIDLRGFSEDNMTLLIEDEDDNEETQPTDFNIRAELCYLLHHSNPGDILFIHLIAHGCHCYSKFPSITTSDKQLIADCHFRILISIARDRGCTLTFVSDCLIEPENSVCCKMPTGLTYRRRDAKRFYKKYPNIQKNLIMAYPGFQSTTLSPVDILKVEEEEEEETTCITPLVHILSGLLKSIIFEPKEKNKIKNKISTLPIPSSSVILFNAFQYDCKPKEEEFPPFLPELCIPQPKEVANQHRLYGGFTTAILDIIEETQGQVTNVELARKAMEKLRMQGMHQKPGLSCSDHRHAYTPFCAYT
ncbi:hypothetical protein OROGR_006135 [Orobanche gracilis]